MKAQTKQTPINWDSVVQTMGFNSYDEFKQIHPDKDPILYGFEKDYFEKFPKPAPVRARIYIIDGREAAFVDDYAAFLYWKRVVTPPLSVKQLISRIRKGQIEGFKDERVKPPGIPWMIFMDSARKYLSY